VFSLETVALEICLGSNNYKPPQYKYLLTPHLRIVFWKEHSIGGHFPSVERPSVLVKDIREFTGLMNPSRLAAVIKSGKLKK
jgi:hypothetical protein